MVTLKTSTEIRMKYMENERKEMKAMAKEVFKEWIELYSSAIMEHAKTNNISIAEAKKYAQTRFIKYYNNLNLLQKEKWGDEFIFKEVIIEMFNESVFNYNINPNFN